MIDVAVVGASGYGGGELLRLLLRHPEARLRVAVSETYAGRPLADSFPGLAKRTDLRFERYGDGSQAAQCDVVFLAQENGRALETAPPLLEAGCRIVDLSADFRFRDPRLYADWYGATHTAPQWTREAVYGLPELYREQIRHARLVGNPGCFPTAATLALAPLLRARRVDPDSIVIDAKSGISGAGRSKYGADYHFPEANESVSAYKIAGAHRHTPEIEQTLSQIGGQAITVTFTPHLAPMTRGILATCYATLQEPAALEALVGLYAECYAGEPFVAVLETGLPGTKSVQGSNLCCLGLGVDSRNRRVTVVSVIDNLVKGAAGQAIQNMNLLCGFAETAGLEGGALWP